MAPDTRDGETAEMAPFGPEAVAGPSLGVAPAAWFQNRMFMATADRILSASVDSAAWMPVHGVKPRALMPGLGEIAEKLGLVQDGPAAAMMRTEIPGSFGIGNLTVLQAPGDRAPCLYALTRSIWGAQILRSIDGKRFESVRGPDDPEVPAPIALAGLAVAGDWLITAPAPVEVPGKAARVSTGPVTIHARKGKDRAWQTVSAPGFGASVSGGVTALAVAQDRVYAAVEDVHRGFELWSAEPKDDPSWGWTRVLDRGAGRYSLAPRVTAMVDFGGALCLATAISETGVGVDRAGPAAAELLRVHPEGWDVLVGAPRFSPDGFKTNLSGLGPGFGDPYTSAVLNLTVQDGILYAGTRNTQSERRLTARREAPPAPRKEGARIWATSDGIGWRKIDTAGHDDPSITAIRALFAGPSGLCAAVAQNYAVAALTAVPPKPVHDEDFRREALRIWA